MIDTIALDTNHGQLHVSYYEHGGQQALLIKTAEISDEPYLRIHSSCLFSEALHANDCDCALQLNAALDYIAENNGIVIYLYQEGRGVGLALKIKAIALQQTEQINTAEAYHKLGLEKDPRTYAAAVELLKDLNIKKVIIDTNNPNKKEALESAGIEVVKTISLEIPITQKVQDYRSSKSKALQHYNK